MSAADSAMVPPKKRRAGLVQRRQRAGLWFVLPAVLFTLLLFAIPLVMTVWMSLYDWPLIGTKSFQGFENYVTLVKDEQFWKSLWFTTLYTLLVTPPIFFLAFALAPIQALNATHHNSPSPFHPRFQPNTNPTRKRG